MSEESLVTDLCTASFSGNLSTIKFILGKGVDVDKRDSTGMTALTRACVAGKSECIKLLLAAHANVNNPDAYGDAPLHYAAFCGSEEVVRLLLGAGADVNALGGDGSSPLYAALLQEHEGVAVILRAKGAKETPADPALASRPLPPRPTISTGFPSTIPTGFALQLANEGAGGYRKAVSTLMVCAFGGDLRGCHELLTTGGVEVDAVDEEGFSAMHKAAAGAHHHLILLLLGHGADANLMDGSGRSPLHHAAQAGSTECVHILLSAGCEPAIVNQEGLTAEAVARSYQKWAVIRLLTGAWTKVPNLDFSYGVVREGPVRMKRSGDSFGVAVFPWKSKYALLSRSYKALFIWSGSSEAASSAIVRVGLEVVERVDRGSTTQAQITLLIKSGPPLNFYLDSPEVASQWAAGFESLLASQDTDSKKSLLLTELLLMDGAARKNMRAKLTRKERISRDALVHAATRPKIVMTDLQAALLLQRATRGHRIRALIKNWVKFKAQDGDVYYYNVKTKESVWDPPWERRFEQAGAPSAVTSNREAPPTPAPEAFAAASMASS